MVEHLSAFEGKKVVDFEPGKGLFEPSNYAYRLRVDPYDGDDLVPLIHQLAGAPDADLLEALLIGAWGEPDESSAPIVQALVDVKDKLPTLWALFVGDIDLEECEISWITQSDLSPLFQAFPYLETFQCRGGNDLSLGEPPAHPRLKTLIVETGGLSADVVRQVASANFPELEHLELWLGQQDYGGDSSIDDVLPILSGKPFPKLRTLALRNCEYSDAIASALATSPILDRLRTLDLSMGTFGDEGALALLATPGVRQLETLNVDHHFMSPDVLQRLRDLPNVQVIADEEGDGDEDERYTAVGE